MSPKSKETSLPWKEVAVAGLVLLSLILMINLIDCIISPMQYPATTMVTIKSLSDYFPSSPIFYSAVFVDEPVSFKQRYELNLNSLEEVEYERRTEWYLTQENASFGLEGLALGVFENVSNIEVNLNGHDVEYYVSEFNLTEFFPKTAFAGGQVHRYYWIKGFNLTEIDKIYYLELKTKETSMISYSRYIKTPWFFSENYGIRMVLPISNNFLEKNQTSGANILDVNLKLEMRRIIPEYSGWIEVFTVPLEEWDMYYNEITGQYDLPSVWYPINQEYTVESNHYIFTTYFSKENVASGLTLVIVPDIRILMVFLMFVGAPFYIIGIYLVGKQLTKNKKRKKRKRIRCEDNKIYRLLTNPLSNIIELYALLLSITTLVFGTSFWSAIKIIQNMAFLYAVVVVAYPAFFFFVFKECISEKR